MHTNSVQTQDVLLKTAIAPVRSHNLKTYANILFDEGAQRSFISEKLADELQLPRTGSDIIQLSCFGETSQKIRYMDTADIFLETDSGESIKQHVLIVPNIATPLNNRTVKKANNLPYLRGLKSHPVVAEEFFEISLLVGADHYWQVVEDNIVLGNGPTAMKSKIGYLLSDPLQEQVQIARENYVLNIMTSLPYQDDLDRFWKLESLGIKGDEECTDMKSNIVDYQRHGITFAEGKYTARLPWKQQHEPLPTNYAIAKRRTEDTLRRLNKQPELLEIYNNIIADQEKKGFIEKVPSGTGSWKTHPLYTASPCYKDVCNHSR